MIRLYQVSKYYHPRVPALHEITCAIRRGEFVFVTGASGAGKTTFLKLLYGAERADRGRVVVNGRDLGTLRPGQLPKLRRRIGVVYQDFKLIPYRTIFDNIALPLRVQGLAEREAKQRVWSVLKQVGLTTKVETFPPMLSGGEQQRVALARALVAEPTILLADEPTGNLDPTLTMTIMSQLKAAHRRGTTVVVATHDSSIIERLPERTIALEWGKLVAGEG
ncbi:MAG: cell division ATP-binding protein FtsE [Nitrospinota bacterium]